jgi:hypothetical protein
MVLGRRIGLKLEPFSFQSCDAHGGSFISQKIFLDSRQKFGFDKIGKDRRHRFIFEAAFGRGRLRPSPLPSQADGGRQKPNEIGIQPGVVSCGESEYPER